MTNCDVMTMRLRGRGLGVGGLGGRGLALGDVHELFVSTPLLGAPDDEPSHGGARARHFAKLLCVFASAVTTYGLRLQVGSRGGAAVRALGMITRVRCLGLRDSGASTQGHWLRQPCAAQEVQAEVITFLKTAEVLNSLKVAHPAVPEL